MSKLATVQGLNNLSGPQLQIVQSVQNLQEAVSSLQVSLQEVPAAVATEVTNALEPLNTLREEIMKCLTAYDAVTAHQRQTLDALTEEMANRAAQAFEAKANDLDRTLYGINQSAKQINELPQALMSSAAALKSGAETLAEQHPPIWHQALMLILVSILTALLVLGGRPTFEHFLPNHEQLQQAANFGHAVWDKATPQERARLNEIINRPAK